MGLALNLTLLYLAPLPPTHCCSVFSPPKEHPHLPLPPALLSLT